MNEGSPEKKKKEHKSFWTTLPGILTGLAALVTAITGIVALFISRPEYPSLPILSLSTQGEEENSSISLDLSFAEILKENPDLKAKLGFPLRPPCRGGATLQHYTSGFMLWLYADPCKILVFVENNQTWRSHPHITLTREELMRFRALPSEIKGRFSPAGGFLQVWLRLNLDMELGVPLREEEVLESAVVQFFENGLLVRDIPWFSRTTGKYHYLDPGKGVLAIVGTKANRGDWKLIG
jgi:hypothetical protein